MSILMVARDAAAHIDAAIASVRAQSLDDWELVLVDDGSRDDTVARAQVHAAADPRIRLLPGPQAGLAAVRNASFAAARGRWAAIVDSDDILHPEHLAGLLSAARTSGAEMVASNMVEFRDEKGARDVSLFAKGAAWSVEREIGLADYIYANTLYSAGLPLGYLKPLFDLVFLRAHDITYDPRLRIGEDYDLVVRGMAAGGRLRYLPAPTYFYRRHAASTSQRLTRCDLSAMLASADAGTGDDPEVRAALALRRDSLVAALAHTDVLAAIKARAPVAALRALVAHPRAAALTVRSVREGVARRLRTVVGTRRTASTDRHPAVDMALAGLAAAGDVR